MMSTDTYFGNKLPQISRTIFTKIETHILLSFKGFIQEINSKTKGV